MLIPSMFFPRDLLEERGSLSLLLNEGLVRRAGRPDRQVRFEVESGRMLPSLLGWSLDSHLLRSVF